MEKRKPHVDNVARDRLIYNIHEVLIDMMYDYIDSFHDVVEGIWPTDVTFRGSYFQMVIIFRLDVEENGPFDVCHTIALPRVYGLEDF